jgi:CRISPR-associated protein Cas2
VKLYVVAYDIPSNKRRRKVAELLEGYGQRAQWSVFECVLTEKKRMELQQRLQRRIKLDEDHIRFYHIPTYAVSQVQVWGGPPVVEPPVATII